VLRLKLLQRIQAEIGNLTEIRFTVWECERVCQIIERVVGRACSKLRPISSRSGFS
jgi:hypothetical protein